METNNPNAIRFNENKVAYVNWLQKLQRRYNKQRLLLSLSILGFVVTSFTCTVYFSQTGKEKSFTDRIHSLGRHFKPTNSSSIMRLANMFLLILSTRFALKTIFPTLHNLSWNKNPHQTISKEVFDALTFKNLPENPADMTPYSALDRKTLEEQTALLDFSSLSKKQQKTILQGIIDTCAEHPAAAKLFRYKILPTGIKKGKINNKFAAVYRITGGNSEIVGNYTDFSQMHTFLHEYAHTTQTVNGFRTIDKTFDPVTKFLGEAQANAYEHILNKSAGNNSETYDKITNDCVKDIKRLIYQKKITLPSLTQQSERERFILGLAQDQLIGKLMGLFIALPDDILKLQKKYGLKDEAIMETGFFDILVFQNNYNAEEAYKCIQQYPEIADQFLEGYSRMHNYPIRFSNAKTAPNVFENRRVIMHKINTKQPISVQRNKSGRVRYF